MDSALQPASSGLQINRVCMRARLPPLHIAGAQLQLRRSERRLQKDSRWRKTSNHKNMAKGRRCSAPPAGSTLNPLEQVKRGANIFQPFCWGDSTGVASERDGTTPKHARCQIWSSAGCHGTSTVLHLHANVQKYTRFKPIFFITGSIFRILIVWFDWFTSKPACYHQINQICISSPVKYPQFSYVFQLFQHLLGLPDSHLLKTRLNKSRFVE